MDNSDIITVTSNDGQTFQIQEQEAFQCETIKNLVEDGLASSGGEIPLPEVDGKTFAKVIEYCQYYTGKQEVDQEWDNGFCKMENSELFTVILAANWLDNKKLLDTCCTAVANMIKGKTPDEIRTMFGIQKDFNEEEEQSIRKENEWIEEK